MSRLKAKNRVREIVEIYAEAEWDEDLWREMFGPERCFKCGSEEFEEALDFYFGIVYCCSECPELETHD